MRPPRLSAIRVGLIGYGYAGRTFHAPLIQAVEGLALYAVASSRPDAVHADWPVVTVHPDPQAMIVDPDIDLVVIATPNTTHADLARRALDHGKAVVVDKPFTVALSEARDLVGKAAASGQLLSVFHNRRWDSDFLTIRQAMADDLIGRVTHFESRFDRFRPDVRARWREETGAGSGIWNDLGPHLVDQALLLFGLPDRVQANLATQRSGAQTDDWSHVILFYGQTRIVLQASMLVAGGQRRFMVHGERGTLEKREADRQEAQLLGGSVPGCAGWGTDTDPLIVHEADGTRRTIAARSGDHRAFYQGIVAALQGQGPAPVTPVEALAVMAVVEAAAMSAVSGSCITPDLTDAERGLLLAVHADRRSQAATSAAHIP